MADVVVIFVFSPGNRRQSSNVTTAASDAAHSSHNSRRSTGGQAAVSRRQQVSHTVRQAVNSIQPQVSLDLLLRALCHRNACIYICFFRC